MGATFDGKLNQNCARDRTYYCLFREICLWFAGIGSPVMCFSCLRTGGWMSFPSTKRSLFTKKNIYYTSPIYYQYYAFSVLLLQQSVDNQLQLKARINIECTKLSSELIYSYYLINWYQSLDLYWYPLFIDLINLKLFNFYKSQNKQQKS